jgi:peptidoglycan/LPS O-acetylase OafA/YrhL
LAAVVVGVVIGSYVQAGIYQRLPVFTGFWVPFWDMKVFWHGLGAVLVVFGVTRGAFSIFFQGRFVQFLGKVSFSLYLIHIIVVGTIASRLFLWLPKNPIVTFFELIAYLIICLLLSWLYYRFVDKPSLKLSRSFAKSVV